jgi:hypothetical protein
VVFTFFFHFAKIISAYKIFVQVLWMSLSLLLFGCQPVLFVHISTRLHWHFGNSSWMPLKPLHFVEWYNLFLVQNEISWTLSTNHTHSSINTFRNEKCNCLACGSFIVIFMFSMSWLSRKCGSHNVWQPYRPQQLVRRTAFIWITVVNCKEKCNYLCCEMTLWLLMENVWIRLYSIPRFWVEVHLCDLFIHLNISF